jgi:hypothetical protein
MLDTGHKLQDANFLRLEDYGEISKSMHDEIKEEVDEELEYPVYWLKPLRREWALFKPIMEENLVRYGDRIDLQAERIHYGIHCYLKLQSDKFDLAEAMRLQRMLESKRMIFSKREEDELREIIRPILSQVAFNKRLSGKIGAPFVDWKDLEPFYQKLSRRDSSHQKLSRSAEISQEAQKEQVDACQHIFSATLPDIKPNSVDDVIKFIKQRSAVRSLRDEISQAIYNGIPFDQKWADAVKEDAALAQISYRRRQQKFKWVSRFANHIPGMGTVLDFTREGAEALVEWRMEKNSLRKYEWYYAMLEIKHSPK